MLIKRHQQTKPGNIGFKRSSAYQEFRKRLHFYFKKDKKNTHLGLSEKLYFCSQKSKNLHIYTSQIDQAPLTR